MSGGTLANSKRMLAKLAEKKEMGEMSKPEKMPKKGKTGKIGRIGKRSPAYIYDSEKLKEMYAEKGHELASATNSSFGITRGVIGEYIRFCTVADVICLLLKEEIVAYSNNRGSGSVSLKTVNEVSDNFNPHAISEITIGRHDGKTRIADGHSRAEGLIRRWYSGRMTVAELNAKISVRIVPPTQFLKIYEIRNSSAQHTAVEKITNRDYMFGDMFQQLNNRFDAESPTIQATIQAIMRKSHNLTSLTYVMNWLATTDGSSNFSYVACFDERTEVKKLHLRIKGEAPYQLNDAQYQKLCDGIRFYATISDIIRKDIKSGKILDRKPVKTVMKSGPTFGLIVGDYVSGDQCFKTSSARLASRIMRNASELSQLTCNMTHSGAISIRKTEELIRRVLNPS